MFNKLTIWSLLQYLVIGMGAFLLAGCGVNDAKAQTFSINMPQNEKQVQVDQEIVFEKRGIYFIDIKWDHFKLICTASKSSIEVELSKNENSLQIDLPNHNQASGVAQKLTEIDMSAVGKPHNVSIKVNRCDDLEDENMEITIYRLKPRILN